MRLPIAVTFRHMPKSDAVRGWVYRLAENKLEKVCDHINRCEVAIERPNKRTRSGSGFRVRIDMTVSPGHDVVVTREPGEGSVRDDVYNVLQDAFEAARRRLKKLNEQQHGEVKFHEEQVASGVVSKLYAEHGFLQTVSDREIYFHRNSIVGGRDFEELRPGVAVAFTEELGEHGPQASSVRIMDGRGEREIELPPVDAAEVGQQAGS